MVSNDLTKYNFVAVDTGVPIQVGDYDGDGIADLMLKFDHAEVVALLEAADYGMDRRKSVEVTVVITGEVNGIAFKGSDVVRLLVK